MSDSDLPFQERVARAIANAALQEKGYNGMADAAIALCMEEAAREMAAVKDKWLDGTTVNSLKAGFVEAVFKDFAAAIRALATASARTDS